MFSYPLTPACNSPHVQDPVRSWESDRRQAAASVDTSDIYWKKYDGKLKVFNTVVLYTCSEDNGVEVTKLGTKNQDIFLSLCMHVCMHACVGVWVSTLQQKA